VARAGFARPTAVASTRELLELALAVARLSPHFTYLSLHRIASATLLDSPTLVVCHVSPFRYSSDDDIARKDGRDLHTARVALGPLTRSPSVFHPYNTSARPLRFVFQIATSCLSFALPPVARALHLHSSSLPAPPPIRLRSRPRSFWRPSALPSSSRGPLLLPTDQADQQQQQQHLARISFRPSGWAARFSLSAVHPFLSPSIHPFVRPSWLATRLPRARLPFVLLLLVSSRVLSQSRFPAMALFVPPRRSSVSPSVRLSVSLEGVCVSLRARSCVLARATSMVHLPSSPLVDSLFLYLLLLSLSRAISLSLSGVQLRCSIYLSISSLSLSSFSLGSTHITRACAFSLSISFYLGRRCCVLSWGPSVIHTPRRLVFSARSYTPQSGRTLFAAAAAAAAVLSRQPLSLSRSLATALSGERGFVEVMQRRARPRTCLNSSGWSPKPPLSFLPRGGGGGGTIVRTAADAPLIVWWWGADDAVPFAVRPSWRARSRRAA
jgi:hypothetical protein